MSVSQIIMFKAMYLVCLHINLPRGHHFEILNPGNCWQFKDFIFFDTVTILMARRHADVLLWRVTISCCPKRKKLPSADKSKIYRFEK